MMFSEEFYTANGFKKTPKFSLPGTQWSRSDSVVIVDRGVDLEVFACDPDTSVRAICSSLERVNKVLTFLGIKNLEQPSEDPTLFPKETKE